MKAGLPSHVTTDIPIGVGVGVGGGGNLQGRTASCAWLTLTSDTDIV